MAHLVEGLNKQEAANEETARFGSVSFYMQTHEPSSFFGLSQ